MDKLLTGPEAAAVVDINAPVAENIARVAKAKNEEAEDVTVVILDRPRHQQLIEQVRATGARIRLISDGDLSAGIAAAVVGSGVHAVMGTGGAPEGVLTAAAMRCLNGEIFARLVVRTADDEERCRQMGITDFRRVYKSADLASADSIIFAATGVTGGTLMRGVRFFGDGIRTSSIVMQTNPHLIRFIDTIHVKDDRNVKIHF
jgi:fructose-1,6-bisphosphatase/sedoheptulose 1,7-bisphosphatase-like protein